MSEMLEAMRRNKRKFLPQSGYNVVGVDDFELPGEQMFLVGHYPTREAAQAALEKFKERNPGHEGYVYDYADR